MLKQTYLFHTVNVLLLGALALLLTACGGGGLAQPTVQASSQDYLQSTVTLTPLPATVTLSALYGPVTGPQFTQAPLVAQAMTATATPQLLAIATSAATYGSVIIPGATVAATRTPTPTITPITSSPLPTSGLGTQLVPTYGAVVDPNYTPPPTFTAPPPATPIPAGTLPPAVTTGPSPTPGPTLRADLMGIQIHGFLTDVQWAEMLNYSQALGVGWIKVQIPWKEYEPSKGNFTDFYQAMVLNVQRASNRGFRTMISIAKAPGWSRPLQNQSTEDGPPANPQDLADFIARFVRNAKPEAIDAIEVWNEPNLLREWRDKPLDGALYMAYFKAAYEAIIKEQQAQPSTLKPNHRIMVITAAPAPTITNPDGTSLNDRDWINQLYLGGLAQYGTDVVLGIHPYGWANSPEAQCCQPEAGVTGWYEHPSFYFRNNIDEYRAVTVRNNDLSRKLWVTEFGWATYDGLKRSDGSPATADPRVGWEGILSQQQQAQYVLRAFYMVQQPPYYEFMGPMMLWNLNFSTVPKMVDDQREEAGFSLLDQNGNPRPVFNAIKDAPKQTPVP